MADKLMFPVGFDLENAVKTAEAEWISTYQAKLSKAIENKPLSINVTLNAKQIDNLESVAKQLDNLESVKKRIAELKLEPVTPETKNAISSLIKELKNLEKILENIDRLNEKIGRRQSLATPKDQIAALRDAKLADAESKKAARERQDALKEAILEERKRQAAIRTEEAERRRAEAVNRTNSAYKAQGGYIDRLLKRTAILFSIGAVTNFARSIREVTAEFELQRVALGAIIQDTQKANELFSQIKAFAVKSPFEIKDLVSYTKQLSAYQIETEQLFETTKRLADVSAGLGVSMDRIILAYGQVKAASVLRGSELRQFTEAGIPLVQMLADKFTQLRGEMVSTGEVFDLISKRAVSFEMVKEIFEDMTNAGGIFYDMQEKQSETLAGQWANLKDAYAIMLDEIGNTGAVHGAMEGLISATKTLMENWTLISRLATLAFAELGIYKAIRMVKQFGDALKKAYMKQPLEQLKLAQKEYNAALKEEKALTEAATAEERALAAQRTSTAQATLASAEATVAAANATSKWAIAWKKLSAFLKASWIFLLIEALAILGTYIYDTITKANELRKALKEIDVEGAMNLQKSIYGFERLANKAVEAADGTREQREALDELRRTYGEMIPVQELNIQKLREMKGNYEALTQAVREYINQRTLEEKVNKITETYSKKIQEAREELKNLLEAGKKYIAGIDKYGNRVVKSVDMPFAIDKGQISALLNSVERLSKDASKSMRDIWIEAFSEVTDVTPEIEKWIDDMIKLGDFGNLPAVIRELDSSIKEVSDDMAASTGYVGKYRKEYENLQKSLKGITVGFQTPEGVDTFLSQQDRLNKSILLMADAIKRGIEEANAGAEKAGKPLIRMQDDWFHLVEAIDKSDPGDVSSIKINGIINAVAQAHPQLAKYIMQIQKDFYKLIPPDRVSNVMRETMIDYAESAGISLDNVSRYFIGAGEDIEKYAKNVKESLEDVTKAIAKAEFADARIAEGVGVGVYETTSPDDKQKMQEQKQFLEWVLEMMKSITGVQADTGKGTDNRLAKLKEEVSLLEKVYSKYREYARYISDAEAQSKINDTFGETLEIFKKYGIELPKTAEEYKAALNKMRDAMRQLPKSEKDVMEIGFKIEDVDWGEQKNRLEEELKRLSDEVAKTKTAKEFFDKMLNLTGDRELSATVTMEVYGETGEGLKKKIIEQIEALFATKTGQKIDLSDAINYNTLEVSYLKLAELAEKNKDILLESAKEERDEYISSGLQATAARIENWEKEIQKEKSYSEKRLQLAQETAAKIAEIEKQEGKSREDKDRLQQGYRDKEQREAAKMEYEAFKDTPMYVDMFDDLESASTMMLEAMMEKLKQLKGQWGQSLDPTELKEMQGRMNEIEEQLATRNPFKTLGRALKEYRALSKDMSYGDAVKQLSEDMLNAEQKAHEYSLALQNAQAAEAEYNKAVSVYGANSEEARNKKMVADMAWSAANAAKEALDSANEQAEKTQETVDKYKELIELLDEVSAGIRKWTDRLNAAFDVINDMMDVFGASDVDKQFFNDIVTGFNQVANGAAQAAGSAVSFMSGNIFGGITSGIGAVGSLISGFGKIFTAGKVRRANKEIKRQQKIIDSLQHSYDRLQEASDEAFGSDYVQNFREQQKNLQAQIVATTKQLEAEKSKGSRKDDEKIKQYEENIQDLQDQLEDMQGTLAEHLLGTDLAGAARTFVQSWLDAYKEFGDTRKAIEESMQEMMENLITEALMGKMTQQFLQPLFDFIDSLETGDFAKESTWEEINRLYKEAIDYMDPSLTNLAENMERLGFLSRQMDDELGGELTGISKDISEASEESILGLAAGINTQNFYISHIDASVSQILAIMQGGGMDFNSGEQMTDLITVQNQHLSYLPTIAQNTADIVSRAERAAIACESMAANMDRVVKPRGVKGSHAVNTAL